MIIKNFQKLARSPLRRDALEIVEAGYEAIDMKNLFARSLRLNGNIIEIEGHKYNLDDYHHIYVVGLGKASSLAAKQIEDKLGSKITNGFVIDVAKHRMKHIKSLKGTHPLPSPKNIKATEKIISLLQKTTKDDLVISIICGGGSALLCKPDKLTCLEMQFISSVLLKAGATITEINTIRKHVSLIHGGYMAKYAYPSTVVSLIISDVPGDDISMVASGPTVLDMTTKEDAELLIKKYELPPIDTNETPKDKKYFALVNNILVTSGSRVVAAMGQKANQLGYGSAIYSRKLSGMAKQVGPAMAKAVRSGQALLACGETQVIVTKSGKGGRNQDVVLSAVPHLAGNSVIISAASDGKDNVNVAGGIADSIRTVKFLKHKKIDPLAAVNDNKSYRVLKKLKDHLFIKKTTANISDFILVLRDKNDNQRN
ncbi:MAG: DUF4147 domain-containing protein [bacterium]|nr:DUF4147 domain-containing protein [bacterium]